MDSEDLESFTLEPESLGECVYKTFSKLTVFSSGGRERETGRERRREGEREGGREAQLRKKSWNIQNFQIIGCS